MAEKILDVQDLKISFRALPKITTKVKGKKRKITGVCCPASQASKISELEFTERPCVQRLK